MSFVTTHPFAKEELMAFCDGELSGEEMQAVEAHLAECRECADQVRQFRETSQSLASGMRRRFRSVSKEPLKTICRVRIPGAASGDRRADSVVRASRAGDRGFLEERAPWPRCC